MQSNSVSYPGMVTVWCRVKTGPHERGSKVHDGRYINQGREREREINMDGSAIDAGVSMQINERIEDQFCHESFSQQNSPTIFRVPPSMRCVDADAYEPQILSIGPYHRGKLELEAMEKHKRRYLKDFLTSYPNLTLEKCLREMRTLEARTRISYSETVDLSSQKFVEMMLLDGCFLVEFLMKLKETSLEFISTPSNEVEEPIFSTVWILPPLVRDMLLLENQIPFFIPQRLFNLATTASVGRCAGDSLVDLHFVMFNCLIPLNTDIPPTDANHVHHLLHLFHAHLLPSPQYIDLSAKTHPLHSSTHLPNLLNKHSHPVLSAPVSKERKAKTIPSVTELQDAGVKFQKNTKKVGSIMEIEFKQGIMRIPELNLYPNTISFFRNFVAFEQCYPNSKTHFTAYACFIRNLVSSPRDVMLLKEKGIIQHNVGTDEELALLFNQIGKGINFYHSKPYLSNVYRDVKCYYASDWPKLRASLMRDYFRNRTFLSYLGAFLLLLLTVTQTLYSVLSYYCK